MYVRRWWDIARLRLRSLVRRGRVEVELEKELRFHLERETEANLNLGLEPSPARLAAVRRLGGRTQIQEECRDMRRTSFLENFVRDVQYALRGLAKSPGFAAVMVLTLALSIGATSAIFSVIDAVLLRPLPYPRADRIVRIFFSGATWPKFPLNPLDLRDIRARNRTFGCIAAINRTDRQLSGAGRPELLSGFSITAGYFRVLGLAPARGREFTTEDELPGRGQVAILSDRIWRTRFAGDPHIVGRTITLDAEPFTVAGVMPPGAQHPGNEYHGVRDGETVDVWTPFTYANGDQVRGSHYMEAIARLKDGATMAQAQADMEAQVAQLGREHPDNIRGWHPLVIPLYQEMVGGSRRLLLVLLGAVGLVLLIACANAANLLLARAAVRQREMAVRAALGAGRWRLVRQMLAESLLIALIGGGLGAAMAVAGVKVLTALLPADFPRAGNIHVDAGIFAFTVLVALATGLLFGLAPALQAARTDLQQTLREGGRGATAGARHLWLRNALVVGEVSLACVLLIGAGLMLRSFVNTLRADAGFQPRHVLTAGVFLPQAKYKKGADITRFYDRLIANLQIIPGVRLAGAGSDLPWTGWDDNMGGFTIEGQDPSTNRSHHARFHAASEDFFQALGTPLVRGRFFTPRDNRDAPKVLIVNRTMARMYWGSENAAGGRISFDDNPKESDWYTVVGVVGDVKDRPNSAGAEPGFWWPLPQAPFRAMSIAVRAQGDPVPLAGAVREAVRSLDPDLAVSDVKVMDQIAEESFSTARFALFLVGLFAALAVTLAGIGIYGVISYSVSQRTHEFGLRMALGAKPADVVRQVMAQGVRLALGGVALGIAAAFGLGRVLLSLLYQVSATDPATFAAVAAAALAIAALACYIPARRATAADPMTSLRAE
ncbi:MAG TPA: ABC transporter permease [Bryobacteraceae bacterium]|nr:ABC transporter permease [Bryobacteraceae bacterium]